MRAVSRPTPSAAAAGIVQTKARQTLDSGHTIAFTATDVQMVSVFCLYTPRAVNLACFFFFF